MTNTELRQLLDRLLADPGAALKDELRDCELSSLEIERQSGITASLIRAVRNGQSSTVQVTTWGPLMRYLLSRRKGLGWLGEDE